MVIFSRLISVKPVQVNVKYANRRINVKFVKKVIISIMPLYANSVKHHVLIVKVKTNVLAARSIIILMDIANSVKIHATLVLDPVMMIAFLA